ncbi:MAG: NUDIX hydrolase [Balneolales bacterium]|nr:NUDIX hydrolase [Balneolales bacterium]
MTDAKVLVEKTLSSKEVFRGKLLHVFYDEAELPQGGMGTREWIKHPGACAVVPVFENGDIMLIKQFRYSMAQIFYEVPAGKIDPGESQDTTALRELEEEAGLQTEDFEYIGHFFPAVGYADEVIHVYAAWNLNIVEQKTDADEFVLRTRMPFEEAIQMVHSGEINDGKTVVCLLRAWHWLQQKKAK